MKKIYILILFIIFFGKGFSQNCISLGCATSHTGIITDGSLPDTLINSGLPCYNGNAYKQLYWQFFYSPAAGNFTQTYTPTSGIDLAINYEIFDVGTLPPVSVECPVSTTGWSSVACDVSDHNNLPVGPGFFGVTLTTIAGHYYAIVIIMWQGTSNGYDASYTFDISTPQLDGVDFTSPNCPGILPVKLSSFGATVTNCVTTLEWMTESQSDFKNYDIQYSTDGSAFQTIANIAGSLQASRQKYTYQDNNPKQGRFYYRLKMTDLDGRYVYSKIIALKINCGQNSLFVYPNPVKDILNVNINNVEKDATIATLFDTNGRLIYSGQMVNGTNLINMENFAKGIYLLKLKNSVGTQNRKIIK